MTCYRGTVKELIREQTTGAPSSIKLETPRIAIVGLGKMGLLHAGIHSALNGNPVSVASETDGFLSKMARKILPDARIYQDYKEMIENEHDIQGIIVTTPIHTHTPIVSEILRSKRDLGIFVEKPLSTNHDDAKKIYEAAKGSGVTNMVGFQKRFAATFRRAKDAVAKDEIGTPQFFKSYSFMADIFRKGQGWRFQPESGGVTLEVGPHILDLIIWLFGEPMMVSGFRKKLYSDDVEDYVHAAMQFGSGLSGYTDISWSVRNYRLPEIFLEVHGTNGVLTVCDDYVKLQLDEDRGETLAGTHMLRKPELQPSVPFLLGDPEFCVEDQAFLQALQKKGSVEPDFGDAAKVNSLMDKIRSL